MAFSAAPHQSGDAGTNPVAAVPSVQAPVRPVLVPGVQDLPLVDAAVLQGLEEQLGQPDVAWKFAKDYAAMWGQRQRSLVESVEREDRAAALDALISLKVSSAMVGGLRLVRLAEMLEATLRKGDLQDGATALDMISIHGGATVDELQLTYIRKAG